MPSYLREVIVSSFAPFDGLRIKINVAAEECAELLFIVSYTNPSFLCRVVAKYRSL